MSDIPEKPATTFKDLCLDANDVSLMSSFWAQALGLRTTPERGDALLSDGVAEHAVWINQVPEAKSVKQRVHLDVNTDAISRLVSIGASVADTSLPWTVMTDPEGGEFCAFLRAPETLAGYRLYEVVVDAADPEAIATWWGRVLGLEVEAEDGCWGIGPGAGLSWGMAFVPVPEPKTVKNRIHWDVWGDTATLLGSGAALVRARDDQIGWDVLADPEGNEFCVFVHPSPETPPSPETVQ